MSGIEYSVFNYWRKFFLLVSQARGRYSKSFDTQKQFVHDASHELRTPLTIIKGHLNMLDRWGKNDKETLEKSIKVSLNEVERLTKLVNDLLQLSKAENELLENCLLKT